MAKKYLLAIAFGPVQDFIAASRRTADLQAGSELLTDLAKVLACTLKESHGAILIFPALDEAGQIPDGPNKLLVTVEADSPCQVVADAKEAGLNFLEGQWNQVQAEVQGAVNPENALRQVATFLEFYAVWEELESETKYAETRQNVERLLAGRKAFRDFEQMEIGAGFPRSPLDPARVSVIRKEYLDRPDYEPKAPLWLKKTEVLDAISVIKRVQGYKRGKESGGIPSTTQMAAHNFLTALESESHSDLWSEITQLGEGLRDTSEDIGIFFFGGREKDASLKHKQTVLHRGKEAVEKAKKALKISECSPYYVILHGDGDRMGKALGEYKTISGHQGFSRRLSTFANKVQEIVHKHHGYKVYSGGDDVLALLPVTTALACAQELQRTFKTTMQDDEVLNRPDVKPTLSIGVAIVHIMEPLQVGLEYARRAEKQAKEAGRDALCVSLHTRSGEDRHFARQWHEWGTLCQWIACFREEVSRGVPYELRALAREMKESMLPAEVWQAEAIRIWKRKKGSETHKEFAEMQLSKVNSAEKLEELTQWMTIARFLSTYKGLKSIEEEQVNG